MERINYYVYIHSSVWFERRKKLIGKECTFTLRSKPWRCDPKRLELHHINYKNLGNETAQDVVTVCDRCHHDITWKGNYRRPMWEQEQYTYELLRGVERRKKLQLILWATAVVVLLIIYIFMRYYPLRGGG